MLNMKIEWREDVKHVMVNPIESDFYKEIGKVLLNLTVPNTICVSSDIGSLELDVKKRGTFIKDGITKPSMYVTETYNDVEGLQPSSYERRYLTCINTESNNYKFYELKPGPDGIGATYGRIGSERGEAFGVKDLQNPYPNHLFWIRYYEKLSKGYTDQSDIYLTDTYSRSDHNEQPEVEEKEVSKADQELYDTLMAFAHHVVEQTLCNSKVTVGQVEESKRLLEELGKQSTVEDFNEVLTSLLTVSPRKVRYVNVLLATSTRDFSSIVEREEDLVAAMEAVSGNTKRNRKGGSFASMDIEVYEAKDKQREQVLSKLSPTLQGKVKNIYRVIPKEQQKKFNAYLKEHHIKRVKQLWHGSRNQNWMSIIYSGLQLNPNAIITGKMFGKGIYFANSSDKSWGYTSSHGSRWAHGSSNTAFMGLYATAYGHPLDVSSAGDYNETKVKAAGCDCVHAHAGVQLYNDEIIYYNENAMVLNYIVEFEN